jgi:hypothetical protein
MIRTTRRQALFLTIVAIAAITVVVIPTPIRIDAEELTTMANSTESNLAIEGYDPVAYFDGAPQRGRAEHSFDWRGRRWRFVSAAHRDRFAASPASFAPAFNGHCAFAMSLGKVTEASPTSWMIADGKLYLHKNPVAKVLFRVLPGRAAKAAAHWKTPGFTADG